MGTGGSGNFDSDSASETVDELTEYITDQIQNCLNYNSDLDEGGEGEFMPLVHILGVLCEQCGAEPPYPDVVEKWRNQYLKIYDEQIDGLSPVPGFKEERRKVISDTFGKLETLAHSWWDRFENEDSGNKESEEND